MSSMYIHGVSALIADPTADTGQLREEVGRYTPEDLRRMDRFILLAMLGAHRCLGACRPEVDTAIYLTTEHGNLAQIGDALDEVLVNHTLPKPFGFVNTMSGTAAFYIARSMGVRSRNITVSSQRVSFERGLELLDVDFSQASTGRALIGGVDAAVVVGGQPGLAEPCGWRLVDGSAWCYVKAEPEGACGSFRDNKSFRDQEAMMRWLAGADGPPADVVAFGAGICGDEADVLRAALRPATVFDYLGRHGYCGSATACGVCLFLQEFPGRTLLHLNRDPHGHFAALVVESS